MSQKTKISLEFENLKKENVRIMKFISQLEENEKWVCLRLKKLEITYDIDSQLPDLALDIPLVKELSFNLISPKTKRQRTLSQTP